MGRLIFISLLLLIGFMFKNDILIYNSYSNTVSINFSKIPIEDILQLKNIEIPDFKK